MSARFAMRLHGLKPKVGVIRGRGKSRSLVVVQTSSPRARSRGRRSCCANANRRIVKLKGENLTIVGIDDLWSRRAEPSRAFKDVVPATSTIVLAHNPDTALYARHLAPGVMLSGHTHGGVVRIPFYGSPLRSILRIGKQILCGTEPLRRFLHLHQSRARHVLGAHPNQLPSRDFALQLDAACAPPRASIAPGTVAEPVIQPRRRRRMSARCAPESHARIADARRPRCSTLQSPARP